MIKRRIVDKLLPVGTPRRQATARIINRLKGRDVPKAGLSYEEWIERVEPANWKPVPRTGYKYAPLISIVVPAYNKPEHLLRPLVDSLVAQTYTHWELVFGDGSTTPEHAAVLAKVAAADARIKIVKGVVRPGVNTIVANTNVALKAAQGEYVAFMDDDDTLAPQALNEVAAVLQAHPETDVFYSDEDKLSEDGKYRSNPLMKPDWSPALIYTVNYCSHLTVVRARRVEAVKGLREGFDGAQDYDFMLRLLEHKPVIRHIPKVLYHWRAVAGSTAIHPDQKAYVSSPAVRALEEHAVRQRVAAKVLSVENMPTTYRYQYEIKEEPPVYVALMDPAAASIFTAHFGERTSYQNYQVVTDPLVLSGLPKDAFILFMDPALEPENDTWLTELVGVAAQPGSGMVGGWIRTSDTRTVEAGYILDHDAAAPLFVGAMPSTWYHNGHALWPRTMTMVSPRCCLVRAGALARLHDTTDLGTADVLLAGLKLGLSGHQTIFWPYAKLLSKSPGSSKPVPLHQKAFGVDHDPFFNPNLRLEKGQIELNPKPQNR